jgi:hypothetical protein
MNRCKYRISDIRINCDSIREALLYCRGIRKEGKYKLTKTSGQLTK